MPDLRVRNVDPDVMAVIREMARKQQLSTEQFLKAELAAIADREMAAFLAHLRHKREELRHEHGEFPDSTPGIRAEREARW